VQDRLSYSMGFAFALGVAINPRTHDTAGGIAHNYLVNALRWLWVRPLLGWLRHWAEQAAQVAGWRAGARPLGCG